MVSCGTECGRNDLLLLLGRCRHRLTGIVAGPRHAGRGFLWARPAAAHATGTGTDLPRGRAQLIVLRRGAVRPAMTATDRAVMVLLAGRIRVWREALLVVRPATLLRWHRAGFRAPWRRTSRPGPGRPPVAAETVTPIRRMAADNPRRGAERIRGERLKPGLRAGKRTTRTPSTGRACTRLAAARGIRVLRTPVRAPRANAVCARSLGSVRRACPDHRLISGERQLLRVLREYGASCNRARPHQGLGQAPPAALPAETTHCAGPVRAVSALGGLHHRYERAA